MRFSMRRFWLTAALSAAALAAGCGGDDGETPAPTGLALKDLPPKYAELLCDAFTQCFGILGEVVGNSGCQTQFENELADMFVPQVEGYIEAGTVAYHGDKAQACLDAIKASGCDLLNGVTPSVCEAYIEGKVARGGDCNASVECVGDDFCAFDSSACPGTCTGRKSDNEPCEAGEECVAGLTCQSGATPDSVCRKPATAGQACDGPDAPDCEAGLSCVGATGMASGTCKAFDQIQTRGLGEACNPNTQDFCQEGLSCAVDQVGASPTFKCVGASATGAACRVGVPDPCPNDEYCDADVMSGSAEGICHKLPTDGQSCVELQLYFGPQCAVGAVCDGTETCRAKRQIGEACMEDVVCYSQTCEGGKCSAPPACDAPDESAP